MKFLKIILFFLLSGTLFSQEIKRYEVKAFLDLEGNLKVTEDIYYDFKNDKRHGIYRDIPTQIKLNGKIKNLKVEILEVLVDNKKANWEKSNFLSNNAGKFLQIKIGSKNILLTGVHHYKIKYILKNIILPYSKNSNFDALRFNIIGNGWKVPIYDIYSEIYLPYEIANNIVDIKTYSGVYGSTFNSAKTKFDGNVIKVFLKKLEPFEALTIEIAFKKGLIKTNYSNFANNYLYLLYLPFAFFLIKRFFNLYSGFKDNRAIAPQYMPPKDLSILQAGLILDSRADNKDFAPAILELATKGYIKIEQIGDNYSILKVKNSDENLTKDQQYLMDNLLFENGLNSFTFKQKDENFSNKMQNAFEDINKNLYNWSVEAGYFRELPSNTKFKFFMKSLLASLPIIAYAIYFIVQNYSFDMLLIIIFPLVFSGVGISLIFQKNDFVTKIMGVIFIVFGFLPLLGKLDFNKDEVLNFLLSPFGAAVILIAVIAFYTKDIGSFTKKGAYTQKYLLGLKEFIKRVKEDEIRRRLKSDPLYLEKLLPYAMLFGVTNHWIELFNKLGVTTPTWYVGDIYSLESFDSAFYQASSYTNTSSSGGFAGGGGFSGGGVGGGGGGSW
jgi:uncharacterized membrane protein